MHFRLENSNTGDFVRIYRCLASREIYRGSKTSTWKTKEGKTIKTKEMFDCDAVYKVVYYDTEFKTGQRYVTKVFTFKCTLEDAIHFAMSHLGVFSGEIIIDYDLGNENTFIPFTDIYELPRRIRCGHSTLFELDERDAEIFYNALLCYAPLIAKIDNEAKRYNTQIAYEKMFERLKKSIKDKDFKK